MTAATTIGAPPEFDLETRQLDADTSRLQALEGDDGQRRLRGYGVLFERSVDYVGGFREEFDTQAANRTLSHPRDIPVTLNGEVIGRTGDGTARIGADDIGLRFEVDVPKTPAGEQAWALARRGALAGTTCTFSVPSRSGAEWHTGTRGHTRRVGEFRLHELGLTTSLTRADTRVAKGSFDAYTAARVTESAAITPGEALAQSYWMRKAAIKELRAIYNRSLFTRNTTTEPAEPPAAREAISARRRRVVR